MAIEERIMELEEEVSTLREQLAYLTIIRNDRFVTPAELAEIMQCARNTVYQKIREGKIYATNNAGNPRIPMSQFYDTDPLKMVTKRPKRPRRERKEPTVEEMVFGN